MKVFNCNGMKMVDSSNFFGGLVQVPVFIGLFSAIRNIVARGGRFVRIRDIAKPDYLLTPGVTVVVACAASPGPNIAGHNRMLLIIFPVVLTLFFLSYNSAGIGLYWSAATGNIFMEFEFILT